MDMLIEVWWKGVIVVFTVRGIYVATDRHSYDDIFEIALVAVFWPIAITYTIYEWLRYYIEPKTRLRIGVILLLSLWTYI